MSVTRCQSSYRLSASCLIKFCSNGTGGRHTLAHTHTLAQTHIHTRTHTLSQTRPDVVQVNNVGQLVEQPRQTRLTHFHVRCSCSLSLRLSPLPFSLSPPPPFVRDPNKLALALVGQSSGLPRPILSCLAKLFTSRLAIIQLNADAPPGAFYIIILTHVEPRRAKLAKCI